MTKRISQTFAAKALAVVMYFVSSSSVHDVADQAPQPWCLSMPAPKSKSAAAMQPQIPAAPCTGNASRGSSIFSFWRRAEAPAYQKPPMILIIKAEPDSTLEHGAVIETNPAKIPLHSPPMSYFFVTANRMRKTVMPPEAAESV